MATHSSTLAWKIPWMEEPGRLHSMGSLRVGHDWATSLSFFTFLHWRRKWQPTPVFLPGESQGRRSLVGCSLWGRTESDTTEATQQQQQQSQIIPSDSIECSPIGVLVNMIFIFLCDLKILLLTNCESLRTSTFSPCFTTNGELNFIQLNQQRSEIFLASGCCLDSNST